MNITWLTLNSPSFKARFSSLHSSSEASEPANRSTQTIHFHTWKIIKIHKYDNVKNCRNTRGLTGQFILISSTSRRHVMSKHVEREAAALSLSVWTEVCVATRGHLSGKHKHRSSDVFTQTINRVIECVYMRTVMRLIGFWSNSGYGVYTEQREIGLLLLL